MLSSRLLLTAGLFLGLAIVIVVIVAERMRKKKEKSRAHHPHAAVGRWVYHDVARNAKYKLYIGQYNRLLLMPVSSTVDSKRDLWVWHRHHDTTSSAANFGPPDVLDDGGLITMELQAKPLAFALTSRGGNGHTLSRPQKGKEGDVLVTSNLYDASYHKTVDCNAAEKDACFELIARVDGAGTRGTAVVFEWEA